MKNTAFGTCKVQQDGLMTENESDLKKKGHRNGSIACAVFSEGCVIENG